MEEQLIWYGVATFVLVIFVPYYLIFHKSTRSAKLRKAEAKSLGIDRPRAQYPMIDASLCIGCSSCVDACPEGDVLGVVKGVAVVINGQRCVGHGYCEVACPVGALKVGLGDIKSRPDIPVLTEFNETTVPGLFIAGELGGLSLIRNAIAQGRKVVDKIASDLNGNGRREELDVVIIGAGPAGLSAALTATKHKLTYLLIDEREVGGTILHYPRRKMVMTQPVEIPLYGWLRNAEYSKEFLVDTWKEIITRFNIKVRTGERLEGIQKQDGRFVVQTIKQNYPTQYVVLALGRRGTPRKLDIPSEEQPKVMYSLIDAQSYNKAHVLVVGGGDSAIEAAIGLGRQTGNTVTISYRKSSFFRVKKKNEDRINQLIKQRKITPVFDSQVTEVREKTVILKTKEGMLEIPNDYVFVMIGGVPPFEMLKAMGIMFGGDARPLTEETPPSKTSISAAVL